MFYSGSVVSFPTDTKRCPTCDKVLNELENIDDDTDKFGVDFVKIGDKKYAKQKGVTTFPTLQYYRNQEPITYEGIKMQQFYLALVIPPYAPRIDTKG